MKLIVGLGNPGDKYKRTRHNAGFMAADHIAEFFGFEPFKASDKFKAEIAEGEIAGEKVILAKPTTYMNLSGQAVKALRQFYRLDSRNLVVIHDEVAIPVGSLRIRPDGSAGGHNGIKSLLDELGTADFIRVRIGIKPDKPFPGALENFVLGRFTEDEMAATLGVIDDIPKALETLFSEGVEEAMNRYN